MTVDDAPPPASHTARAHLTLRARGMAFPLPDALMALVLGVTALSFLSPALSALLPLIHRSADELMFSLFVEGGILFGQATLVDVATRLRKRPPIWAGIAIAVALVLVSQHTHVVLRMAWDHGLVVFIPLLFSLAQRATLLWSMPVASRIEKLAARALISNRITMALLALAFIVATMIGDMVTGGGFAALNGPPAIFAAGTLYFAVAAFDDWRVRRPRFAEHPTVLFRFDPIHFQYLDPL